MIAGGDHSDSINSARKLARALHGELLAKHAVANITNTTTAPDGTKTTVAYQNWQATGQSRLDAANNVVESTTTGHDALRRPVTQTHSRTGLVTTNYATSGQVASIDDHGRLTAFAYDSMGRRTATTLPDTTVTHTSYWPTGQVKATWGSQTNPTVQLYNPQGQPTELRTFRSTNLALAPDETTGNYDATTWTYNPRQQLTRKQYADGKGTDYTHTPAGRLKTRAWGRNITTTYNYDSAGELTTTNYSDATPDVAITYEPLGRQSTVTTVVAKSEFTYDPTTLAVDTEVTSYNLDATAGYEFFRVLDRSRDALGRDTGFILGSTPAPGVGGGAPASTIVEAQAAYAYAATDGRLAQISNPQIQNQAFTYQYLPNSDLIEKVTGPIHTVINEWEPTRDVLDTKTNKLAITVISKYDYAVNAIGQRTGVATSGTAYPAVPSWLWSYDALGQVIAADSSVATSDRAYQYDAIGNRQKTANSLTLPVANNYVATATNAYSSIQLPGAATALTPGYDFDGNMTSGPLPVSPTTNSTLLWDGENRLTEVKNSTGTTLEQNLFDASSRKIATTVNGITTIYLYDGWNCIAEYTRSVGVSPTLQKIRLWGTDLSGSMQGAGGVGGILSESSPITSNPITFNSSYPTYDGNGNVSEYLNSTGQVTAHFEYDPFGITVVNTDTSNQFAYRFSTKPLASATGLYYYGYRYYDPLTGRWPSRDPIEEMGGVNLYGFVGNNGVNRIDFLGLRPPDVQLKNCTIAVYGGHGLAIPPENDGVKDPDSLNGSDVPINIQCPPCSAATVIACNANKTCNVNNVIPGAPLTDGSPLELDPVEPENSFCPQFARAVEAAKEHAKTICNKTPACCKKVKVQAELLGRAKGMCKSTVGKSGYKGWIYDCDSETLVEGD